MNAAVVQKYTDSKLYLQNVTTKFEEHICYQFLWIVKNYKKVEFGIEYACHCLCIGEEKCFLKIKRSLDKYAKASDDKKRVFVNLAVGLSPNLVETKFKLKNYSDSKNTNVEEKPLFTPNGSLEITCEITLFFKDGTFPDLYIPLLEIEQTHKVYTYMDAMFFAQQFSDVCIHVGKKIFPVHRVILATRSKVFETMLKANMKEKNEKKIVIKDCESEIFGEFLHYIYSNKLSLSNAKEALELYKLSEKYGLEDLKLDVSTFLARNLNANNVIQIQTYASLNQDSKLKEAAMDYMSRNLLEVMKSHDWSLFISSRNDVESLFSILGKLVSEDKHFDDFRPLK